MKKQDLLHITSRHYSNLKKYIDKVVKRAEPEDIHQFRVEYKKLRAFLRMLSEANSTILRIKVSNSLRRIFTVSGAIRDLQLQQQRVLEATKQQTRKPRVYLNLLQLEIDKLRQELDEIVPGDPVKESKKKTDISLPIKFSLSSFKSYSQKRWATINSILVSGHYSDDNIHSIRKILKDLLYNLHQYEGLEYTLLSVTLWKGKEESWFNELITGLGDFRDRCISVALLRSYWLNSFDTDTRQSLEQLKKEWIKDKIRLKKILIRKMRTGIIPLYKDNAKIKIPANSLANHVI